MKVLSFGSLNIDYVYSVEHFMKPGETQASYSLDIFCGGKGLNQSIALSRSKAQVYHAGAVGESDSAMLINALESAGVNTKYIKRVKGNSGHAIIQKDITGQNSILLFGGANQQTSVEYIKEVLSNFENGDFIILQNEISCIKEIMEEAYVRGLKIVFNPSPMNSEVLKYPLNNVEYFILNEVEAREIIESEEDGEELIKAVANKFPNAKIILTLGEKGAFYHFKDIQLKHNCYSVEVTDTTAAGDTFLGYFIGSIAKEYGVEEALELASKAAAISVTRLGASTSIPELDEVINNKFIEKA